MVHLQGNRGLIIALFLLIFSVYLATYSGRIESSDTLRVADATSSLVHFNDALRDEAVWEDPPQDFDRAALYPFASYEPNEPVIVYAASIPFRIAELFPEIGLIHAMWLLNTVLVSFSVLAFYVYARTLGYEEKVAILATILLALTTAVWPYSKTLFREPLAMLILLLTALAIEKWRKNYRHFWWLILALLGMILGYFSKNSTIAALPALLILTLPDFNRSRWTDGLLALAFGVTLIFAFVPNAFAILQELLRPIYRLQLEYAQTGLQSYLFSIGASFWATSPVLLLGIGAFWQRQRRIFYAVFVLVVTYAFGHVMLTEQHWFGGLSWPPRFLVPVIPFAALLILPSLQWLMQPKRGLWRVLALLLIAYSFAVQAIASISVQDAYVNLLPSESGGLVEWSGGMNDPRYLRWLLLPQSWSSLGFDTAWTRSGAPYFIWIFLALALLAAVCIWQKRLRWLALPLLLLNLVMLNFGLHHLYWHDPLYWATNKPKLFDMLAILQAEGKDGEPLLMAGGADVTYERFMMNYNRLSNIRPVVLGFQRSEATSAEDSPETPLGSNTTDLLAWDIPRIIDFLANKHERLWWLAQNSVFTSWAIRPEERYLVENYYLLHEFPTDDPTVRLLEFLTVRAPHPDDFRLPENRSDLWFGEHIRLNGFSLPLGTNYHAGDAVPISFYWQSDTLLDSDYTISWFIVNETGAYRVLQGIDSQPKGGFAPTTAWQLNQTIVDNRAIELPLDVPAGNYQIWLRVYPTGTDGSSPLAVSGGESTEGNLAILPVTLIVN